MSKIIYLSNVDRRFAMMKLALTQLQEEGRVSAASAIVKVEDNTQWSDKLATTLQDADFVMLKWMGGSIETPFFKQFFGCLDKHQVKYYVDAAGADTPEVSSGVGVDIVKKIKEYTLYNGLQNYRNLLLYAQYLCDGVTSYQEPDVLYWAGMYIPIVVAMAAGQNVVAALSGGMVAAVVSVIALTATVFIVRWLNGMANDYDTFTWDDDEKVID